MPNPSLRAVATPLAFRDLAPPRIPSGHAFVPNHGVKMSLRSGKSGGEGRMALCFHLGDEAQDALYVRRGERLVVLVAMEGDQPVILLRKPRSGERRTFVLRGGKGDRVLEVSFYVRLNTARIGSTAQPWSHETTKPGDLIVRPEGEIANAVRQIAALGEAAR